MDVNYTYSVEVLRVVDGDTFDGIVDCGFSVFIKQRFRLLGINTPEKFGSEREEGLKAKAFVEKLLEGKTVTVVSRGQDKYGRWLAVVYLEGQNVCELLLTLGYAEVYRDPAKRGGGTC